MASIGTIDFGLHRKTNEEPYPTAVICALTRPFAEDVRWSLEDGSWIVVAKRGSRYICANGRALQEHDRAKNDGINALMQALDLACMQSHIASNLSKPGDNHIVLFKNNDQAVARITSTFDLAASMDISVEVRNKDGEIVPQPMAPAPVWHRALRYYRLSQLAGDIYEAYRNLYLAFEAIAEALYPRAKNEREGEWVRRCFKEMHGKYNLSPYAPNGHSAPSEYLFGTLYEHTRCSLFHARTVDSILPFYETDTSKMQNAYATLLRIWRQIASSELHVGGGGGVITYQGYKHWMDNLFSNLVEVAVTNDTKPPKGSDTKLGPAKSIFSLEQSKYISEVVPGMVGVEGFESNVRKLPVIRKIGLISGSVLHAVAPIEGGLDLFGVDLLQVSLRQRLIQDSQPKTLF